MSRVISFLVLIVVILLVAALFFRVMIEFIVPMFLAAVMVVIFRPLHTWFERKIPGHPRMAALATAASIVLIVLVPILTLLSNAFLEVVSIAQSVGSDPEGLELKQFDRVFADVASLIERAGMDPPDPGEMRDQFKSFIVERIKEQASYAIGGVQWVVGVAIKFAIGLAIMVICLYYFLADGPGMLVAIMRLSPLDDRYELELLQEFSSISRAVVLSTLLSAMAQGLLAGIGYYFAGMPGLFLLTALTMLFAMVPFIGSAAIWFPVCVWLFFYEADSRTTALVLGGYCAVFVANIDNVIKPYVLHGRSNLHPLLALLSVLGGVAALGPIGILVGPMAVSFLQALLGMLQKELDAMQEEGKPLAKELQDSRTADDAKTSEGAIESQDQSDPNADGQSANSGPQEKTTKRKKSRRRRKR